MVIRGINLFLYLDIFSFVLLSLPIFGTIGAVLGKLGAGKTLYISRECYYYHFKRKYTIFTNYELRGFRYLQLEEPEELIYLGIKYPKLRKFCALDEGYLWFDALEKSADKQAFFRNLINVTRKLKYHLLISTQTLGQFFYRGRLLIDYYVIPKYDKTTDSLKVLLMYENEFGEMIVDKPYFVYNASRFFKYYDTNEVINDFIKNYMKPKQKNIFEFGMGKEYIEDLVEA